MAVVMVSDMHLLTSAPNPLCIVYPIRIMYVGCWSAPSLYI